MFSGIFNLQQCENSLHLALILHHKEFVILLLQNGAFFKAKDQDTRTQIEEGLMRKQMTVFETMIAYTH